MEYNWSNPSWKRSEAKSKQEDYQSKLARDMHNFHHCGGNVVNAYGGSNHENGNFIPRRHVRVGNFSSYAKSTEHTSYDDYGGVAKVESLKPSMIEEFSKVNELPQAIIEVEESVVPHVKEEISNVEHCDLMREKNIEKGSIEIKEKERVENKES
ncbi:hypothetical protein M9H77_17796 [Catharanthus roseus]|uniref:Uncharacterized protein n=1 Tax=Catharanthus roseus TaxID=4058 RepID=A0ACC0B5Z2_CATRO|nr:hypothetical protein M9H77_17796 [Catharanthus roseus]